MEGAKAVAEPPAGGQLESALLQIMQQHHNQSIRQRQQTERVKKNAVRSASRVAGHLVEAVDGGVQELFVNEKRIELEARALLGTITRYRKQTDQWLAATNAVNSVLKHKFGGPVTMKYPYEEGKMPLWAPRETSCRFTQHHPMPCLLMFWMCSATHGPWLCRYFLVESGGRVLLVVHQVIAQPPGTESWNRSAFKLYAPDIKRHELILDKWIHVSRVLFTYLDLLRN